MIHVCFAITDPKGTYSKYTGTAICSLLENTKSPVTIHIIHDENLSEENKSRFISLTKKYDSEVCFYQIDSDIFEDCPQKERFTVGTFFRLKSPGILPKSIEKIIYLDSDLIVNLDIRELWETDIEENVLAAVPDSFHGGTVFVRAVESGLLSREEYFNSGVLVVNLRKMREKYDWLGEVLSFLEKYPFVGYPDQDATNYIFRGKIFTLDERFNFLTSDLRGKNLGTGEMIYHFAGDAVNVEEMEAFDRLFFHYLFMTPWGKSEELLRYFSAHISFRREKIICYQSLIRKVTTPGTKKILFGAKSVLHKMVFDLFRFDPIHDYLVDNNPAMHGQKINGLTIFPPERIKSESREKILVLVSSIDYYDEIKSQLKTYGLTEDTDFFDVRRLLLQNQGGYYLYY